MATWATPGRWSIAIRYQIWTLTLILYPGTEDLDLEISVGGGYEMATVFKNFNTDDTFLWPLSVTKMDPTFLRSKITFCLKGAVVVHFMNAKSPIGQHFLNATSPIGQKNQTKKSTLWY